jgi:hypothetical protein
MKWRGVNSNVCVNWLLIHEEKMNTKRYVKEARATLMKAASTPAELTKTIGTVLSAKRRRK